jgi:urease accessory protein
MSSRLAVTRVHSRSVVTSLRSESPLRLLSAAGGGHAAWVYQSSLGGGFVGRDDVALALTVERGATLFLSTQASSKVYRATDARFSLDATVGDDACLIAWPDPVTCFAGATFQQTQRFSLARSANLIVVDPWTAGRAARGERWQLSRVTTRLSIEIEGERVLDDGYVLDNAHGTIARRMFGVDAFSTIVLIGERFAPDSVIERISVRPVSTRPWITASRWPWGVLVRIGAADAEALAVATRELIGDTVRGVLGGDPWARRS